MSPVLVVWDMNSCPLPEERECHQIRKNIGSALGNALDGGSSFRVIVYAFGDIINLPASIKCVLDNETIHLTDFPESPAEQMILDMKMWARKISAPAHFLVISGDRNLPSGLDEIRIKFYYNIHVAHPDGHPDDYADLFPSASCLWNYKSVFRGDSPYHVRTVMLQTPPESFGYLSGNVLIWWDLYTCPLPEECDYEDTISNICSAVANALNNNSYIKFTAYGNSYFMPAPMHQALLEEMTIVETRRGFHSTQIMLDMQDWASAHNSSANHLLISGINCLSSSLDELRSRNCKILVAHPHGNCDDLLASASCVWDLPSLFPGESPYQVA